MPAKIWVSCSHNRCEGKCFFLVSGTQESEDQEYMHKPFEPEPSSGSFAAANVKLADPLRFWPVLFPATVFDDKNRSRA
jgi:hypothetical protein